MNLPTEEELDILKKDQIFLAILNPFLIRTKVNKYKYNLYSL